MVAALRARNAPFRNPGWIMSPQPVRDGRQPADGVGRQLRLDGEGGLADGQPGATAAPTSSGLSAVTTWRLPSWPRSTTPHSCTPASGRSFCVRTKSRAQSSLRWYLGSVDKSHAMVGHAYA